MPDWGNSDKCPLSIAPGVYEGLSNAEYHADPALSSSGARTIVEESPGQYAHNRAKPQHSAAFDIGSALHATVLSVGEPIEILRYKSRYSDSGRSAIAEVREAGLIPLLEKESNLVQGMAESVFAHSRAREFLERRGRTELSAFTIDPGSGVRLKARADRIVGRLVDVKTTDAAGARDFRRSVERYRYDVQWAFYDRVFRAAGVELERAMSMIVVEKKPPYFVAVHDLDDLYFETGAATTERAIRVFAECAKRDEWPGPPDSRISPTASFDSRVFEEEF